MIRAACLALVLATATPSAAQDIRPQDAARLAEADATLGRALRQALAQGSRGDVDLLQEAMAGAPLPPVASDLSGDWKCRTLKLGGLLPLVAYAPFDCAFTPDGTAFRFEKRTGSQLTRGRVALRDGALIYLGTGYVADAVPPDYADLPADFTGDGTIQPQVGIVEQVSPTRARILFPSPVVESDFDILYLTR